MAREIVQVKKKRIAYIECLDNLVRWSTLVVGEGLREMIDNNNNIQS